MLSRLDDRVPTPLFLVSVIVLVFSGCSTADLRPQFGESARMESIAWHHPKAEVRGSVLIFAGLNTHQKAMEPIAEALAQRGYLAGIVVAKGSDCSLEPVHENDWLGQVSTAMGAAHEMYPAAPPNIVGYSLGALLVTAYLDLHPEADTSEMVYLAPALSLSCICHPVRLLQYLGAWDLSFPSLAPKEYRACPRLHLSSYQSTTRLYERTRRLAHPNSLNQRAATVLISRQDSLISFRGLKRWIRRNRLDRWELFAFEPSPESEFPAHVILDERSLGEAGFLSLLQRLEGVFENSALQDAAER